MYKTFAIWTQPTFLVFPFLDSSYIIYTLIKSDMLVFPYVSHLPSVKWNYGPSLLTFAKALNHDPVSYSSTLWSPGAGDG